VPCTTDSMLSEDRSLPSLSVVAASTNLTKNLVGSGIFSLPWALRQGSLFPGLVTLLSVGLVQASSFVLIAFLCERLRTRTYRGVLTAAFGRQSGCIVDMLIAINGFSACVAYNILIADFFQKAVHGLFGWAEASRSLIVLASTLAITLPLCHVRNLSRLSFTSVLGLVIIAFVIMYVLSDFLGNLNLAYVNFSGNIARLDMGIFQTIAISNSAFQAHYNAPKIFNELGCNLQAHACATVLSFGVAFAVYSSFAVAGLGLFGTSVRGNVLNNYPADGNFVILWAWLGMAFSIIFTFPLVFTSGRDSLISLLPALQRACKRQPMKTHVVLTSSLVMATAMVACMVQDVSLVIALAGATIGSLLCWIFPAGVYLRVVLTTSSGELQPSEEPLLPSKKPKALPTLPNAGLLVMYIVGMALMGTLTMSVGIGNALGLL